MRNNRIGGKITLLLIVGGFLFWFFFDIPPAKGDDINKIKIRQMTVEFQFESQQEEKVEIIKPSGWEKIVILPKKEIKPAAKEKGVKKVQKESSNFVPPFYTDGKTPIISMRKRIEDGCTEFLANGDVFSTNCYYK